MILRISTADGLQGWTLHWPRRRSSPVRLRRRGGQLQDRVASQVEFDAVLCRGSGRTPIRSALRAATVASIGAKSRVSCNDSCRSHEAGSTVVSNFHALLIWQAVLNGWRRRSREIGCARLPFR